MGTKQDWPEQVKIWEQYFLKNTPIDRIRTGFQTGQDGKAPSWVTVRQVVKEFPSLSQAQVRQLPDALQERWRELQSEAEQAAPIAAVIEEQPYEETSHKQKMRELAKVLAESISLPSPCAKDLWTGLPVEFKPGKYPLSLGTVEIAKNGHITVSYYDIYAGNAKPPHLVEGLYSHLWTFGLSKFAELVGDNGKLNILANEARQYSEELLKFLKLIADEARGFSGKMNYHGETKPGLARGFIVSVWQDAIQRASGRPWLDDDLWYPPPEPVATLGIYQQRCGGGIIGIAKSKMTLKNYENRHKKLRVKFAKHPSAQNIAARSQELSDIAQEIKQRLQEFSDMESVRGHCELCPG